MLSKKSKMFLIAIIIFTGVIVTTSIFFRNKSHAGLWTKAVVKLYSNGQVSNTWEATDLGKIDGNSIIFTIADDKQIRICGTYSVEIIK